MDQNNFTKWFRSEIVVAFAIGSAVAGGIIWIMSPVGNLNTQVAVLQNTLAELKSNDLVHIELEQTTTSADLADLQKEQTDTNTKIIEILTLLEGKNVLK